jgi:uncharacterized protein YjbI with pentapeptide repeats
LSPTIDNGRTLYRFNHVSLSDYFISGPVVRSYRMNQTAKLPSEAQLGELALLFTKARLSNDLHLGDLVKRNVARLREDAQTSEDLGWAVSIVLWLEHGAEALGLDDSASAALHDHWKRLEHQVGSWPAIGVRGAVRRVRLPSAHLSDMVLNGYDLSHRSDLSGASVQNCTFFGSDRTFKLSFLKMDKATVTNCRFFRVDVSDATVSNTRFENCVFDQCEMSRMHAAASQFNLCTFTGSSEQDAELTGADFAGSEFVNCQFNTCKLVGAAFDHCSAKTLVFRQCDLDQITVTNFPPKNVLLENCRNVPPYW